MKYIPDALLRFGSGIVYFSALKNAIQSLEEKLFYDVALLYLKQQGYQKISIVDGPGDGGRDVVCSRSDLFIQLSVRKDWEKKINEEAQRAVESGRRHLIYITNKIISPAAEERFRRESFNVKGQVEISVVDLRRLATALAQPGTIQNAYEVIGMRVPKEVTATPKEIAISTLLLFSNDAREVREEIVEANIRAHIFRTPDSRRKVSLKLLSVGCQASIWSEMPDPHFLDFARLEE